MASLSFLFALCFSLAAQNGCEDEAGNVYGPYEELVVSDDPCENFTCIPSAFSFVWVSNSEYLDDCGVDEDDEVEGEDWAELIEWLEEVCASNDTLEVDIDIELVCDALVLIGACDNGNEEACVELDVLMDQFEDLWDDEDEDGDDDEEEDGEDGEDGDEEDDEGDDEGEDGEDGDEDDDEGDDEGEDGEDGDEDDDEGDDEGEDGEDGDEEDDEEDGEGEDGEDGDENGEDDEDEFDEEEFDALIEWLEEICGSNVPNDLGFDPDMACGILELIEACANGSEEACEELEMLLEDLEDLWDEEDEEDGEDDDEEDDEEEEEAENECEVEFEFEQAMDEDGVPLPYNIMAYVDEPEAGTYYFWSFGDGNESDEPNPTHIYDEVGNYEVCLTVSQMIGNLLECTSTYCDTLMIDMDGLVRQQMVLNILFPGQTINAVAEQEKTLKVHPNPAADNFRVLSEAGIESVVARTMDGRWVGRWLSNGRQTMEVPCNAWPTGAYVLEVRTSEGVMRSRVLVQH